MLVNSTNPLAAPSPAPVMAPALAQLKPLRPITPGQFKRLRDRIAELCGINLTDAKQALLVGRLSKRLRFHSLLDFGAYCDLVEQDEAECIQMLDCISTNETYFFREPKQFEFLENDVFPAWKRQAQQGLRSKHVRIWSAGCSTGEEPYSVAISLLENLPQAEGWSYEILATDISTKVLATAREGIWPIERARGMSRDLLSKYLYRGTGQNQGRVRVIDTLPQMIRFERLNLKEYSFTRGPEFDIILCRNVLIYFDQEFKQRLTAGFISRLKAGGYLLLGHAETLATDKRFARIVMPTIVQRI